MYYVEKATTQQYMYLFMKENCTVATVYVKQVSTGYQIICQCTRKGSETSFPGDFRKGANRELASLKTKLTTITTKIRLIIIIIIIIMIIIITAFKNDILNHNLDIKLHFKILVGWINICDTFLYPFW